MLGEKKMQSYSLSSNNFPLNPDPSLDIFKKSTKCGVTYNFSLTVNTMATSPTDDDDVILNHVPLSPSSTIPPNSPGTPSTPGTPVTPGVGTKINLVRVFSIVVQLF